MKGIREIRSRIKAVSSTGQITHAMELVAASKMKKAQQNAQLGRAYATLLMDMTDMLADNLGSSDIIPEKNEGRRLVIVFSTDKGLCGGLNTNLFKQISLLVNEPCDYVVVGNKAGNFIAKLGLPLLANFKISDDVDFHELQTLIKYVMQEVESGKYASIEVLYSVFINTLKQEAVLLKLAPFNGLETFIEYLKKVYKLDLEDRPSDTRQIEFEPSAGVLLKDLSQYYINQILYLIALEAKASEQSSRMVAMKSASENADNLVAELTLEYNKARQGAITTEILELAASSKAMSE